MTIEEAEPHSIVPILYFTPGATHAPHHVPPESPARYAGHVDDGWDHFAHAGLAHQRELSVIPTDAELTVRPAEIPAWDGMTDDLRPSSTSGPLPWNFAARRIAVGDPVSQAGLAQGDLRPLSIGLMR